MSSPIDQAEVPPSAGLVGGKYQLVKLIGRGGMGSVWEARHSNLGTPVAIKFIEAEYANSAEARSRFDKEAKAAATIQSKHAIQVFDNGITEEGKPYIVMELLTGEPLDKRIERLGMMTIQDTARIMQQVCRGLAKAHERGIVHRDLKPENVFIVRNNDDDDEVAKVLDFGIAKVSGGASSPGITSSTKTGAVLGTPFYMSPEQARGLRNVDHRTDVWSLGVIAFKCVTGRLPFDGESVGDLLVKICTAPVPLPSHFNASLPPAFDSWFLRALEREPERRFQNVTELSEHLAFAAGLHDPRARGPMSSQPHGAYGVPSNANGPATIAASSQQPSGPQQPQSNYGPNPDGPYGSNPGPGAYTPNPAGMTNAPFTSSQPVPVAGGRAKWYVGAAAIGLLLAGVASFAVVKMKDAHRAVATNGVTQSAGALTTDPKLDPGPAPPTTLTTADTSQTPAPPLNEPAAAPSEKAEKHQAPGGGKVTGNPRPQGGKQQGVTAGVLASPPPPPPPQTNVTLPPPPPPAPTKKPPVKRDDDPGY